MSKKDDHNCVPNISGSFQIVSDEQQKALERVERDNKMDEKSLYYARIFMED